MSEDVIGGPPRSFYVISGIALLWNLVGVMVYVMQVTMTDEALAAMDPAERALMESMPSWLIGVYALAVNAGALGCLLLILKKVFFNFFIPILLKCIGSSAQAFIGTAEKELHLHVVNAADNEVIAAGQVAGLEKVVLVQCLGIVH